MTNLALAGTPRALVRLQLGDPAWLAFVTSRCEAQAFHHPAWGRLLSEAYGLDGFVLALTDEAGEIVAGVPVLEARRPFGHGRWVALPFSDSLTVLARDAHERSRLAAELAQARVAAGVHALELRCELPGARLEQAAVTHT